MASAKKKAPAKPGMGHNRGPSLDFDVGEDKRGIARHPKQLKAIMAKAEECVALQKQVAEISELLSATTKSLNFVQNEELPKMLDAVGMEQVRLNDGSVIDVKDKVVGSLPKDPRQRQKAFDKLEKLEAGDLIKNFVTVTFGKGQDEMAQELLEELKERDMDAEVEKTVHASSLCAWARERLEDGEAVPMVTLGLTLLRYARVKLPSQPADTPGGVKANPTRKRKT